jgi:hypothetical protein
VPETLAEELLLLAHDILGKCRIAPGQLTCGVGGALLSDLSLAGRLVVADSFLTVCDPTPVGDPVLDEVLADVAAVRRTPRDWVTALSRSTVTERLLNRMVEQGRVGLDAHRTLGIFVDTRYPVRDIVRLWDAQQRVVSAATTSAEATRRTLALGGMAAAAGLGRALFATAGDWRALVARMREISEDDWAAAAVREVTVAERSKVTV